MQMCYVTIYSNFSLERPYVHKAKGSGLGPPPPSEKACIDKGQTETKPYTYCNSTGFENQTGKARSGTKTTQRPTVAPND